MIKAIIFDLDGVIVSTDDLHYQAWKIIADREGIFFNRMINHRLRGVSRRESLEIILERADRKYSEAEKLDLMEYKNNEYIKLLDNLNEEAVLPGILETLAYLKDNDYAIAIGSSSKNTGKILRQIKLNSYFDAVADGNDVARSKPAPDVFLAAAEKLGIEPKECAVIEDALAGIKAAKAAGMVAIAIGDATRYGEADFSVTNPTDLIAFLEKTNKKTF